MIASRKPLGAKNFHQHVNFNKALIKLQTNHVVAIAGPSGAGKTELALQLMKSFQALHDSKTVVGTFRSDDMDDFVIRDVVNFANSKNITLPNPQRRDYEEIFGMLYRGLKERYPGVCKLLIFDDAELSTEIMYYIDRCFLTRIDRDGVDRSEWKFIFTMQDASDKWVKHCDIIGRDDFFRVDGFSNEEIKEFFQQSRTAQTLTQEELDEITKKLGRRPLMLQVLLKEMENGGTASTALRNLMENDINFSVDKNCIEALYRSFERIIKESDDQERYRELLTLLTMFNPTDFTFELLTSCAEVTLDISMRNNFYQRAKLLRQELIKSLNDRCLCDPPEPFEDTNLVSFHKLIMQSMRLVWDPANPMQRDVEVSLKALLALTRVMPRDGRGHQSHVIAGYMYSHASSLAKEVRNLKYNEKINRQRTPCIMLWMSNLHMSMGYCMHVQRLSDVAIAEHINTALDWFAELAVDQKYEQINSSDHVSKATTLFDAITGPQSPLRGNQQFKDLVALVPQFLRLTARDVEILFGAKSEVNVSMLSNGHLDDRQMKEVLYKKKALKADKLEKFYAAELLAEVYATAAKAFGLHGHGERVCDSLEYAKAALELYRRIREGYQVPLMAEVITEREMLHIRLKAQDITVPQLDGIIRQWTGLLEVNSKAFEYGLMRADFANDPYNNFLCREGLTITEGRKCAMLNDDQMFTEVCAKFHDLVLVTESEDSKLRMNLQATYKVYHNYGEFLWRCRRMQQAVIAVIDAFVYLNKYLSRHNSDQLSVFPELEESCGKAKALLKILHEYFKGYEGSPSAEGLLQHDGSDQVRLKYVIQLVACWREKGRNPNDFEVMEKILSASNVDLDHIFAEIPAEAVAASVPAPALDI